MESVCSYTAALAKYAPACTVTSVISGLATVALLYITYILFLKRGPRRAPYLPPVSAERKTKRGSGRNIECFHAGTGEKMADVASYTPEEVKAAYLAAKAAQQQWSKVSFTERRAVLMDINDWVLEHQEEIIEWSTSESGKTATEASLGEVMITCEKIRWIVAAGEQALARESRPVPSMLMTKKAFVEYYPMGVIGIIVPWNYPFHNVLSAAVAAIFAGNGAVVKVSEITSYSAERIENVFRTILARRGHNPDLVQVITGYGDTGAALVKCGVEKVLFIGSPATGRRVMEAASQTLTPVILELGGKDPFIVFDDVNLDKVLDIALRGAFINCGQNCISAERFLVHSRIYDRFVQGIASRLQQLQTGASCSGTRCDFGAITMPAQADIVEALVKDAIASGARLVSGGKRGTWKGSQLPADGNAANGQANGKDVTPKMKIAYEETFGPVMTIMKFDTEADAIRLANSTVYGLGCSIFSADYTRAERIGAQMDCGQVSINDFAMVPMIQSLPFGGCKDSGFGHFNGAEGLRGFSRVRATVTDRFRFGMEAPPFLQYPVSALAPKIVGQGVKMVYGSSWMGSVLALGRMLSLIAKGGKPKLQPVKSS